MFTYKKLLCAASSMPRTTAWRLLRLLPALFLTCPHALAQVPSGGVESVLNTPPVKINILDKVDRRDITYFSHYAAGLGDINGDRRADFAVSSAADSTFIFLGGRPLPSYEYSWVVKGGSNGIRSADFNRDGKMDIVTCNVAFGYGERDPEYLGTLRIYLQKEGPTPFTWEEDQVIRGDSGAYLAGLSWDEKRGAVRVLDFNCDGWPDLLTNQEDTRDSAGLKAALFFGGPESFAPRPDAEILLRRFTRLNTSYARDMRVGDLNGDGCDDILLWGRWTGLPSGVVDYWDLFLGNAEGRIGEADRVLRGDTGWWPSRSMDVMDIDGDGYCDIIDNTLSKPFDYHSYGNIQIFRGGPDLPEVITPNDSIPNLNPFELGDDYAYSIKPIGDMNGDGTPDLLINWFNDQPSYFYYPGGPAFRKPIGYFGTTSSMYVTDHVAPVGDVNGDGYGDLLQMGRGYGHSNWCRYILWSGSEQLRARTNAVAPPAPSTARLTLSPNPLQSPARLHLDASGLDPGAAVLTVADLLGRTLRTAHIAPVDGAARHAWDTSGFAPGVYLVSLRQGTTLLSKTCVVY